MKTLNLEQLLNVLKDNNIRFGAITKENYLIFSYEKDESKTWYTTCLNELSDSTYYRIWETKSKKLTVMDIHPVFESEEAFNRVSS